MPRPPRIHAPGLVLHLIARGNRRQAIFEEDADYEDFTSRLLAEACRGSFILLALCLMPNHVHLVVICGEEPIGKPIHRVLTAHAVHMNRKYGRSGHLFQDRFKSLPCDTDEGLLALVRYVHLNPVRAGLAKGAGDWRWSSHRDYVSASPRPGIATDRVLTLLGEGPSARERFRRFVEEDPIPAAADDSRDLARLAASLERAGGHGKGFLLRHSRCRTAVALRVAFVKAALAAGHRAVEIARFLGRSQGAVSWAASRA